MTAEQQILNKISKGISLLFTGKVEGWSYSSVCYFFEDGTVITVVNKSDANKRTIITNFMAAFK